MREIDFKELNFGNNKENNPFSENGTEKNFKGFEWVFKKIDFIFKILIIVIILILLIELFSFASVKGYRYIYPSDVTGIDIIKDAEWVRDYIKEDNSLGNEYYPYIGWVRNSNFHGVYVNTDKNSLRWTENPCSDFPDVIKIFVFGGSTIWGSGVKDNSTIPSYLSKYLCKNGINVEISNFGEGAFVNMQEMIRLQLELRKGNVPDIVIFYDGINDVYSSYQNNFAGLSMNIDHRSADFNSRKRMNIVGIVLNSYSIKFINRINKKIFPEIPRKLNNDLDKQTISIYSGNIRIIKTLEEEFGFKVFFYWQPFISTKAVLSYDEENKILNEKVFSDLYINITEKVKELDDVVDLSGAFNHRNDTLFIDRFHVFEEGNRIIAERIGEDVEEYLSNYPNA